MSDRRDVRIGTLSLRLPAGRAAEARTIAREVSRALAAADTAPANGRLNVVVGGNNGARTIGRQAARAAKADAWGGTRNGG